MDPPQGHYPILCGRTAPRCDSREHQRLIVINRRAATADAQRERDCESSRYQDEGVIETPQGGDVNLVQESTQSCCARQNQAGTNTM